MKFITLVLFVFCSCIFLTTSLKTSAKAKVLEFNNPDPFKALGIPEFRMDLNDKPKRVKPKLDSIEDLPRFIQSGAINTGTGMKLLTKFLTEDDDRLKEAGGVYDETGNDGLDQDEDLYPPGSEMRNRQRARSAAMLWIKTYEKNGKYEAYGCTPDKEKIDHWFSYVVLLMTPTGEHKLVKVCIEETDGLIAFGGDPNKYTCKEKVHLAETFREKGNAYFSKKGFAGLKIPVNKDDAKDTKGSFLPKREEIKKEEKKEEKKEQKREEKKVEAKPVDPEVEEVRKQIAALSSKLEKLELKKVETKVEKKSSEARFSEEKAKQEENSSDDQQIANDIADMIEKKAASGQ